MSVRCDRTTNSCVVFFARGDVPTSSSNCSAPLSAKDRAALASMLSLAYDELHTLADRALRRESGDPILEPAAVVHEVYLRLLRQRNVRWNVRPQFIGVAVRMMQRIIIDHARCRRAAKRRARQHRVSLDEAACRTPERADDILELGEALTRLAQRDRQKSRVVELRYFAGLTIEQSAKKLGVSSSTIKRDWSVARDWLRREIGG